MEAHANYGSCVVIRQGGTDWGKKTHFPTPEHVKQVHLLHLKQTKNLVFSELWWCQICLSWHTFLDLKLFANYPATLLTKNTKAKHHTFHCVILCICLFARVFNTGPFRISISSFSPQHFLPMCMKNVYQCISSEVLCRAAGSLFSSPKSFLLSCPQFSPIMQPCWKFSTLLDGLVVELLHI